MQEGAAIRSYACLKGSKVISRRAVLLTAAACLLELHHCTPLCSIMLLLSQLLALCSL